jgi:FtsP/CotA-like multicopper oxidase with cupredoxin domain
MRLCAAIVMAVLASPSDAQVCAGSERPLSPSRDLYCIELIPASGVNGVSGRVLLGRKSGASPFTIDVTREGHTRYWPRVTLDGLPEPSTFGGSVYVAWAVPQTMHFATSLGVVQNGETDLVSVTLDKFLILVTAERSATIREPTGRLVLRGASPSTRMQPADLMAFTIGATKPSTEHEHHTAAVINDSLRWTTVPMPPGLTMLPAEMELRPSVAPYLPRADSAPVAQPRRLVRLNNGDTLRLSAGIVRRSFKGRTITMFGFNGQYPGPLLDVPQGAEVVVELRNALDQPTTVHWHGIRLENRFDGVPDLTQPEVKPGGSFVYRLRFPDAGIYWYHPHVREDVQQDLGLYGNIMVRSPRADYFSPVHRDEVLILDDLLLDDTGVIPFGREDATHALMGRFGNTMLVNGEPRWESRARIGEVVRFFFTNVSNTRVFNLSFPGARMKLVASDVGNYEREQWVESVVIGPAERYVVHIRFDSSGIVPLVNHVRGLDHLNGRFFPEVDTLGVMRVGADAAPPLAPAFETLRADTAVAADIARYRQHFARAPDKALVLTIETSDLPFFSRQMMQLDSIWFPPIEWSGTMPGMNWASTSRQVRWILRDPETGRENMDVNWTFRRGDVIRLRLSNERRSLHTMQHTIHLHGQRFLVLAVNEVPAANLVWKDTVLLPAGFTVDLLVDLSNPGRWMLHCHIAEHLTAHMMTTFTVQ